MIGDFNTGPFTFNSGQKMTINGTPSVCWTMNYGFDELAERVVAAAASQTEIIDVFSDDRAAFVRGHRPAVEEIKPAGLDPFFFQLIEHDTGHVLGDFQAACEIPGLTPGLTDDRWPTWLVTTSHPLRSIPMSPEEFERLQAAHNAAHAAAARPFPLQHVMTPKNAWIANVLPDDVMTDDPVKWRAPTSWELRHIVGEGSFTQISGAKAATMVGISPQNFRKYTASDDAKHRQSISFAMWHLLLAKLQIKSV